MTREVTHRVDFPAGMLIAFLLGDTMVADEKNECHKLMLHRTSRTHSQDVRRHREYSLQGRPSIQFALVDLVFARAMVQRGKVDENIESTGPRSSQATTLGQQMR